MDNLRIVLLIAGVVFVAGIYFWEMRSRRSRANDLDDLDTTYLDEMSEHRTERDVSYARELGDVSELEPDGRYVSDKEAAWQAFQEDLPFEDDGLSDTDDRLSETDEIIAEDPGLAAVPGDSSSYVPPAKVENSRSIDRSVDALDLIVPSGSANEDLAEDISKLESFSATPVSTSSHTSNDDHLVIALTLMAPSGTHFLGTAVRETLEGHGFRHGHMQVFHCYDGPESGRRNPFCTVANVVKPGNFELESIADMTTPGLALFMQISGHEAEHAKLDRMLELGGSLASALGGDLLDETRSTLTSQSINHLRERIAEFSRQQRLRR